MCYHYYIKKLKEKIVPVFLIIIFLSAVAIIRNIMPEFICMEFLLTLSTLIMYHTIENPDYILLNEYVKNKELLESNIEDKSNILFKITQDVKNPLRDIKNISNSIVSLNNVNDMHREAQQLKIISSNLYSMINNILDISSSYEDYKYNGQEYNIFELFSQIVFLAKERLNDDIKFDYSINKTVPKCLYGDEIRLKQVVCSLLLNETTRNNCAKINLDISCFIKNDNCRLIINVINDGKEMNLNYINGIMDNNKYDKENDEDDKLFVNLKSVKQIVESLGGQFLINSINGGNEFIVILNQQIKELTDFKYINQLSNKITNKKSILIIDDDYLELKNISTQFRKSGYDAIGSVYGRDCIKMLNDNDKYSLILLDDEMPNWSAVEIIKELEKLKLVNCPIIVMLDKEKESIKKHYLDDFSFTDYFIKSDIKKEIERIEKHIK